LTLRRAGERSLTPDGWIEANGRRIEIYSGMQVSDLMRDMGISPLTHIALVNGRPVPEDYPLKDGDVVEFLMFTVHKEMGGVKR